MASQIVQSILAAAARAESERLARIKEAWEAYDGDHPETLTVVAGGADDNQRVNLCRPAVDKSVSFVFGDGITINVPGADRGTTGETPNDEADDEDFLRETWTAAGGESILRQWATGGGVAGHAFLRLIPPPGPTEYPGIRVLDPATVTVEWEPDDYTKVIGFRVQYNVVSGTSVKTYRQRIVPRDPAGWLIIEEESTGESLVFTERQRYEWLYDFPPIVANQNLPRAHEYWGTPDLTEDVIALQYGINALVSNCMRLIRLHAHPKPWASGMTPEQANALDFSADRLTTLPRDVTLGALAVHGDLAGSMDLLRDLRQRFYELTRTPYVDPDKAGNLGAIAGVALRILYSPAIEKAGDKRRLYGAALIEANHHILALGGRDADRATEIGWSEILPQDIEADARAGLVLKQLGVSQDTILERLGFDPDTERKNREASGEVEAAALLANRDAGGGRGTVEDPQDQAGV